MQPDSEPAMLFTCPCGKIYNLGDHTVYPVCFRWPRIRMVRATSASPSTVPEQKLQPKIA
jgi:hypothetical protein